MPDGLTNGRRIAFVEVSGGRRIVPVKGHSTSFGMDVPMRGGLAISTSALALGVAFGSRQRLAAKGSRIPVASGVRRCN